MKTTVKNTEKNELKTVKEIVKNSKNLMNDDDLLNLDLTSLDDSNFESLISEISKNVKQKKTEKTERMYKIEVDKKIRNSLRKKRDRFIDNVLFFKNQKMNNELKNEITEFNKFYKETYTLNDYSLNSICSNNSDNETKIKVKVFLQIVLKSK